MRVVFFQRKPRAVGNYSLEFIFNEIRQKLSGRIQPILHQARWVSSGFFRRLAIALMAMFQQGPINHITGDINYIAIFLSRRHTVLTILDCGTVNKATGLKRWLLKHIWIKWPIKCASIVLTISETIKRELIELYDCDPAKIKVIYVPISNLYQPNQRPFDNNCPVILQVGLAENKNVRRLIQALHNIPCKLVLIGGLNDGLRSQLRKYNINYEHYTNLTDKEIVQQYCQSDIVAFVSTYEGFGMPIVEGHRIGRPVITSDFGAMAEISGEASCLVDPYSVKSIRSGLLRLISDKHYRQKLIRSGFTNTQRFSTEKIAEEHYKVYLELINRTGKTT